MGINTELRQHTTEPVCTERVSFLDTEYPIDAPLIRSLNNHTLPEWLIRIDGQSVPEDRNDHFDYIANRLRFHQKEEAMEYDEFTFHPYGVNVPKNVLAAYYDSESDYEYPSDVLVQKERPRVCVDITPDGTFVDARLLVNFVPYHTRTVPQ